MEFQIEAKRDSFWIVAYSEANATDNLARPESQDSDVRYLPEAKHGTETTLLAEKPIGKVAINDAPKAASEGLYCLRADLGAVRLRPAQFAALRR